MLYKTLPFFHALIHYISCNTNDNKEWQNTIRHIALEGRCFFINAGHYFTKDIYPSDLHEPVRDKHGIIYEEPDMNEVAASGMKFDPVSHYASNDVLKLYVKDE